MMPERDAQHVRAVLEQVVLGFFHSRYPLPYLVIFYNIIIPGYVSPGVCGGRIVDFGG